MDFVKLNYVIAVAEQRSISKAAAQLYLSQPALTKYINKLEEELGVKLFERNTNPIRLTYAGEWYVGEARKLLAIERQMNRDLEDIINMRRGRLVVGMGISRASFWAPHILPPFLDKCPGIDVRIHECSNDQMEEGLAKGKIDIGFHALPVETQNLDYESIIDERILLAVAPDHSILEGIDISVNSPAQPLYIQPERLNGHKFLGMAPGNGLQRTTQQIFDRYSIRPGSITEMLNCDTVYMLAAEGLGIAFVPESCAIFPAYHKRPLFCTIDHTPFSRKLVVIYKRDVAISTAAHMFINITRDVVHHCPHLQVK